MDSFTIEGMTFRPCYDDRLEEYVGCLDRSGEYESCDNCRLKAKCPINGEEEE